MVERRNRSSKRSSSKSSKRSSKSSKRSSSKRSSKSSKRSSSKRSSSKRSSSKRSSSKRSSSKRSSSRSSSKRSSRQQRGGNNFSLRQGQDFASYHTQQHGGAYSALHGAPLDYSGSLPAELRDSARLGGYDAHFQEASGMSDATPATVAVAQQKGGSRRNTRKNKSRKASKKSKKSKSRKASKKSKKSKASKASKKSKKSKASKKSKKSQRGGRMLGHSPADAPTMLLTPSEAAKAGTGDFSNPLLKH